MYKLHLSTRSTFIFDPLILFATGTVVLGVFIWTLITDTKKYRQFKKISFFLPSILGLLWVLYGLLTFLGLEKETNAPTVVSAFYDGGFNGFSVDFKSDGSYRMANGSGLGESFFYGTYSIQDSVITLDKSNVDNCIRTNTLVIRTNPDSPNNGQENYITQVDKNGQEIRKEFRLRITEDNRAK